MMQRVAIYMLTWFAATVGYTVWLIADSKANLVNDPSSMAWVAFLPYIFPMFFINTGIVMLPLAGAVEIFVWWKSRR